MSVATPFTHPDPGWWKRCDISTAGGQLDLCDDCGHVRILHTTGCLSPSARLDAPRYSSCLCTNRPNVGIWRDPSKMKAMAR